MSVASMLRDSREVWRPTETTDALGGRSVAFARVGVVRCKVDQASAEERESAGSWGADYTRSVYALPSADIRRGDELRGGPLALRVLAVVEPSTPQYRKALCSAVQTEG